MMNKEKNKGVEAKRKIDTSAYLDDVILFTEKNKDHLNGLRRILGKFGKAGLKLKPEKLKAVVTKLVFLRHLINQGTISPNPEKLTVIKQLKPPKYKKSCGSVCGLLSYFRQYTKNYSATAQPWTNL